ncbi:UL36 very large tegument protein [Streptomyces sp. NPDC053431]|uniref:UL36 very large tegument protein n=1 Tax=Streptomyces sp. NPDC053431 TaxID=3365703 RepID=UPI0037D7EA6E
MTVRQLPAEVEAFATWLRNLAGRLDPGRGWYGVFATRDPEGMRACFEGADILPWDVVESLLHDLAEPADSPWTARGRALHEAASTAHDRAPGGAAALAERRELMRREARAAEARVRELGSSPDSLVSPDSMAELVWARDDLTRAEARIAELTARLTRLTRPIHQTAQTAQAAQIAQTAQAAYVAAPAPSYTRAPAGASAPADTRAAAAAPAPADTRPPADTPAPADPSPKRRRPRGARYAWLEVPESGPAPIPAREPAPPLDLPAAPARAPRGARFASLPDPSASPAPRPTPARDRATPGRGAPADQAARAAGNAVYALRRLRAQGRSGEAHALLCEALAGPPDWLPALASELHAAGLGADWATLLWEAASLPPVRLAAVAGALADAGRPYDCDQLLRQGVARPVEELAAACAALEADGRHAEAQALLAAFLRARTLEEAAQLAAVDPPALTAGLVTAARAVSPARERDLLHALRVAGLA